MRTRPKIGDIVEVKPVAKQTKTLRGIVLQVRVHKDGSWTAAELFIQGRRRWYNRAGLERIVGRPRGISRIDQPTRRTHGWFVRLHYKGKNPRLARLFSDQKYQGISQSLQAALAFLADQEQAAAEPEHVSVHGE